MGPRHAIGCSGSIMKPIDITSTPCARNGAMCFPSVLTGLAPDNPIISGWLGP